MMGSRTYGQLRKAAAMVFASSLLAACGGGGGSDSGGLSFNPGTLAFDQFESQNDEQVVRVTATGIDDQVFSIVIVDSEQILAGSPPVS